MVRIEIRDGGDLRKVARDLRRHADGKQLRKQTVAAIKAEVRTVERDVKAAYRSGPSGGGPRTKTRAQYPPLRTLLAKATRSQVRLSGRDAGVRLRVDGTKMPSRMGRLPRLYEGEATWRHRVFGNLPYVKQKARPTFYPVARRSTRKVRSTVDKAADRIAEQIAKGMR